MRRSAELDILAPAANRLGQRARTATPMDGGALFADTPLAAALRDAIGDMGYEAADAEALRDLARRSMNVVRADRALRAAARG